mmetsp:Transcript_25047/g.61704  ORF Transcript_25047/g.61704 Transcript_25047/m.61704 type:complete len:97 (-) Transcript_25047:165-455(-)
MRETEKCLRKKRCIFTVRSDGGRTCCTPTKHASCDAKHAFANLSRTLHPNSSHRPAKTPLFVLHYLTLAESIQFHNNESNYGVVSGSSTPFGLCHG